MGTTAEKLAYLKESKEQIKNALETPSNVMRDYANWIKKYVDNQPTSKVSDGVCTNALDVPLVSIGVDGNSYQGENPSPDNKQDIEVIDGVNLAYDGWAEDFVSRINNPIKAKIETYDNKKCLNYRADVSYPNSDTNYIFKTNWKENTRYTVSFMMYATEYNNFQILYTDGTEIHLIYEPIGVWTKIFLTSSTNKTIKDIRANFSGGRTYIDLDTFMVYEGTTPKPYLPHGHIGLRQSGKNLIGLGTYFEGYVDSSAKKYIDMKSCDSYWFETKDLPDKIKISYKTGNRSNISYSNTKPQIGSLFVLVNENSTVVNINRNYKYINIQTSYNLKSEEVQIEEGLTATSYEPYHSPKLYPINLNGNTLAKVGDIKDLLKIYRNGDVEIEKNVGKYVFTGDEELYNLTYNRVSTLIPNDYKKVANSNVPNLLSNCYKSAARNKSDTNNSVSFLSTEDENFGTILCDILHNNKDSMKSFLKSNYENGTPIYILYELATPQTIELSSIFPVELWQGTNIFKLITNLETDFEVEYIVNKDSILNEVQTAMLEAEIEI